MKSKINPRSKVCFLLLLILFLFGSLITSAYAQQPAQPSNGNQQPNQPSNTNQQPDQPSNNNSNPVTNNGSGGTGPMSLVIPIANPLKVNSIQCLIYQVVTIVVDIGAVLAGLYIIYSGFLFVAAQGNEAKLTGAKKAFTNAIIGTAILLGAWVITSIIVNTVNSVVQSQYSIPGVPTSSSC